MNEARKKFWNNKQTIVKVSLTKIIILWVFKGKLTKKNLMTQQGRSCKNQLIRWWRHKSFMIKHSTLNDLHATRHMEYTHITKWKVSMENSLSQKVAHFLKTRYQSSWRHKRKTELFTHRVYSLYSVAPSSLKTALPAGEFGQHRGAFPSSGYRE